MKQEMEALLDHLGGAHATLCDLMDDLMDVANDTLREHLQMHAGSVMQAVENVQRIMDGVSA